MGKLLVPNTSVEVIDSKMVVWPGQAEMLNADTPMIGLFTGAGYGKSNVLVQRAVYDHAKQDGWWENATDWKSDHLKMVIGAPREKYLSARLIPAFRGFLDQVEELIGRRIRSNTGRGRDGWFGSASGRKQEMANAVDFLFYPFHSVDSAVAVNIAGLYIDEVTMLKEKEIWTRSIQRVRDPRAIGGRTIACTGTPEEDHFIYDLAWDEVRGEPREGWTVIMDSSIRNPMLSKEWFAQVGKQATKTFKEMQVMGRWVRGGGGQRFAHVFEESQVLRNTTISPRNKALQFDLGWDPGYRTGSVVIMYQHPMGFWVLVDEIVIEDMTTQQVCRELLRRGYNRSNVRYLGIDPHDGNKRRSSSAKNDIEIIYEMTGIRPKLVRATGKSSLRVRLDAIEELLASKKLYINAALSPTSKEHRGVVNSLKYFATKKARSADERFLDQPTPESKEKWKHCIDAMHYVFVRYEHGAYRRAKINDPSTVRRKTNGNRRY